MVSKVHILRYLWQTGRQIPGEWKQKKRILERLEVCVRAFVSEHPKASYDEIVARFGTPEQVAGAYLSELDSAELMDAMQIKRRIVCTVTFLAAIVVTIWIIAAGIVAYQGVRDVNGTIDTYIDVYEDR